jgi:hypothetical protein
MGWVIVYITVQQILPASLTMGAVSLSSTIDPGLDVDIVPSYWFALTKRILADEQ